MTRRPRWLEVFPQRCRKESPNKAQWAENFGGVFFFFFLGFDSFPSKYPSNMWEHVGTHGLRHWNEDLTINNRYCVPSFVHVETSGEKGGPNNLSNKHVNGLNTCPEFTWLLKFRYVKHIRSQNHLPIDSRKLAFWPESPWVGHHSSDVEPKSPWLIHVASFWQ